MGQYYHTYVIKENGKEHFLNRRVEGEDYVPAKLMEHSWVGNAWSEAVVDFFLRDNKKARVFWVGDYYAEQAAEFHCSNGGETFGVLISKYPKLKEACANKNTDILPAAKNQCNSGYLLNYDAKKFLDIKNYCKFSNSGGWILHPLPLLTACGNGLSSGDYSKDYINSSLVGCWAGDLISLVENKSDVPSNFEEFEVFFKE